LDDRYIGIARGFLAPIQNYDARLRELNLSTKALFAMPLASVAYLGYDVAKVGGGSDESKNHKFPNF